MNFFEQQLRVILGNQYAFKSSKPVFAGRAAFIRLSDGRRARVEFAKGIMANCYEKLLVTVINVKDGAIDRLSLEFKDYSDRKGESVPYIWVDSYRDEACWYGQALTSSEIRRLAEAAHDFITVYE